MFKPFEHLGFGLLFGLAGGVSVVDEQQDEGEHEGLQKEVVGRVATDAD